MARRPATQRALAVARGDEPADLLLTGGRVFVPAHHGVGRDRPRDRRRRRRRLGPARRRVRPSTSAAPRSRRASSTATCTSSRRSSGSTSSCAACCPTAPRRSRPTPTRSPTCSACPGSPRWPKPRRALPVHLRGLRVELRARLAVREPGRRGRRARARGAPRRRRLDRRRRGHELPRRSSPATPSSGPRSPRPARGGSTVTRPASRGPHARRVPRRRASSPTTRARVLDELEEKRRKGMWVFIRQGSASQNLRRADPDGPAPRHRSGRALQRRPRARHHPRARPRRTTASASRSARACRSRTRWCSRPSTAPSTTTSTTSARSGPATRPTSWRFDRLDTWEPARVWQRGPARRGRRRGRRRRGARHARAGVDAAVGAPAAPAGRRRARPRDPRRRAGARVIGVVAGQPRRPRSLVLDPRDPARRHRADRRARAPPRDGAGRPRLRVGVRAAARCDRVDRRARRAQLHARRRARRERSRRHGRRRGSGSPRSSGGQVAVLDGEVLAEVRLPIGGLMSDRPAAEVADALGHLVGTARRPLGVTIAAPFMQLAFLGPLGDPAAAHHRQGPRRRRHASSSPPSMPADRDSPGSARNVRYPDENVKTGRVSGEADCRTGPNPVDNSIDSLLARSLNRVGLRPHP